jgi:ABC-type transporter Mla MlaB component
VLKVTRYDLDSIHTTLRLEGRVTQTQLPKLERSRAEFQQADCRLVLDLSGVSFVDRESVTALPRMRLDGIIITGCSSFVGELLEKSSR